MQISMIQEDIDGGTPGCCVGCPLVRAIRRTCPHLRSVTVTYCYAGCVARFEADGVAREVRLPRPCYQLASYFDKGLPVQPFDFDFDA